MRERIKAACKLLIISGIFVFALFLSPGWTSDGAQTVKSKVRTLVDRFPAQNTEMRQNLVSELMEMEAEGILEVCMLSVPWQQMFPKKGWEVSASFMLKP